MAVRSNPGGFFDKDRPVAREMRGPENDARKGSMQKAKGAVAVSVERHGRRWWRRFRDFRFAADWESVPLDLIEAQAAAAHLPIVFAPQDPRPSVLLRIENKAAVIDAAGQWQVGYLPLALRIAPFSFHLPDVGATAGAKGALAVYEDCALVTDDPRDERFFMPDGSPAPVLAPIIAEGPRRIAQGQATITAVAALRAAGMLEPMPNNPGYEQVNAEKLAALSGPTLAILHHCGALGLAYYHRASLSVLDRLLALSQRLSSGMADPSAFVESEVGDFLSAIALAHRTGDKLL